MIPLIVPSPRNEIGVKYVTFLYPRKGGTGFVKFVLNCSLFRYRYLNLVQLILELEVKMLIWVLKQI